ncbi:MAG: hypothetical protein KME20_04555 [Kaiparowitsia implicata GSE-PSE-MK54-09C]|nr:hypothetical protein [Kaiparowitsia implicata GSE-PSE-MK54-09C]
MGACTRSLQTYTTLIEQYQSEFATCSQDSHILAISLAIALLAIKTN